jgi:hypothetical protein
LEISEENHVLFAGYEDLILTYRRSDSLQIEGYSDSDYAGEERKSTLGYIFTLAGGAIS